MLRIRSEFLFRARPELVEGYPRALEDILQQVQDERKKDEVKRGSFYG